MRAIAEGGASTDYTGELFILGGIVLTATLGWVGGIILKKLREPTRIETLWSRLDAQDTRIEQQGERITAQDKKIEQLVRKAAAGGRVIRDLARQWVGDTPRLNPDDLAELDEDTIPTDHPWRVKP